MKITNIYALVKQRTATADSRLERDLAHGMR